MTITQDFHVEIGGLLLDPDTDYEIVSITGLEDLPDVRVFDKERALRHGFFQTRDLYGKRVVTISCEIWGDDDASFRANVNALGDVTTSPNANQVVEGQLPSHPFGQWRITGKPRRRSLPIDIDYAMRYGAYTFTVECPDPRVYSAALQSVASGVSSSAGGLSLPLDLPLDLGGTGTSGTIVLSNLGNIETPWEAAIAGPVTNPQVENLGTGQVLKAVVDVPSGSTLIFSSDLRRILLDGASRYNTISVDSSWWDLEPGNTSVRFTGITAGSPTMTVTSRHARV